MIKMQKGRTATASAMSGAGVGPCRWSTMLTFLWRMFLHFVVFAGLCTFLAWIFIWLDPSYDKFAGAFGEGIYNIYYKTGPEAGTVVVDGYSLVIIVYQWASILAAIYAVVLLKAFPTRKDYASSSLVYQLRLRARALARWQTPLHRFWVYWCGGLSLGDLVVVAIYVTLHAFWFAGQVKTMERRFDALRETGLPLPHSLALERLEKYGLIFGILLWPSLLLLFFPIPHISFLSDWLGTHYADMIRWHRWIGHGTMWILSIHGILYYIYWGLIHDFWFNFADWSTLSSINNLAGSIGWFFGLALWATSIEWVRRRFFEIFYRFHIGCFILFVVFSTIHYAYAWSWWLPGLIVYGIDVVLRAGQALNATTVIAHPAADASFTTVEIKLAKGFKCRPAEEIFLLIPQISSWQWHPFSVYEVLDNPNGTKSAIIHCKTYNAWTTELCRRGQLEQPLAARIAGPLGHNRESASWKDYSTIVLIGGGVGAIPVLAMLKDIMKTAAAEAAGVGGPLDPPAGVRRVVFVWVSRHGSEFSLMDEKLLQALRECDWADVSFHITTPLPEAPISTLDETAKARPDPKWLPLTHHWASPLKLPANRPAQARLTGPVLETLTATLAFAGCFFGTVLGYSYYADGNYTGASAAYTYYWKNGMVLLAVQTVMTLGLPYALVILPVTAYCAARDRRERAAAAVAHGPESLQDDGKDIKAPHLSLQSFLAQTATVQYNRPDVFAVIGKAVSAEKGHVGVYAGGPTSLRAAVSNATYSSKQKCNLFGRLVHYFDESFEL